MYEAKGKHPPQPCADRTVRVERADRAGEMAGVQPTGLPIPAPGWIADALTATEAAGVETGDIDIKPSTLASELLDRLPLGRMLTAATDGVRNARAARGNQCSDDLLARAAVANVVAVLSDPGGEVMEFTEIYMDASAALMTAGVPHALDDGVILSLGDRIRWLSRQRPTAPELESLHRIIIDLRSQVSKGGP